jgi:hypothetical protein
VILHSESSNCSGQQQQQQQRLDKLLALELSKLSVKDRQEAEFDIHGVADELSETPELIETSLHDLGHEIERKLAAAASLPAEQQSPPAPNTDDSNSTTDPCAAYRKALAQNRDYVHDKTLRLKFLRAEKFQIEPAADRLIKFFQLKEQLFGSEKLAKDITQSDLGRDDLACLRSGITQILPLPDRAGRTVMVWNTALRGNSSHISRMRTSFYMFVSASHDVDCQRKGMVIVVMNLGQQGNHADVQAADKLARLLSVYPVRFDAFHACIDPIIEGKKEVSSILVARTGSHVRVRTRRHEGKFT